MAEKEGVSQKGYQDWLDKIAKYDSAFKKWSGRVEKIQKRYRDETRERTTDCAQFNVLWSNTQVLTAATYSRTPKPDVSRRFNDQDPVGRVASMILERALDFEVQHYSDYKHALKADVLDRFLGGRGTAWIRYEPHFKAQEMPPEGIEATEVEENPAEAELDYERAPMDYVHWKDFGHTVARTWDEVTGVWRKVYMTRPALVERFGEELGNKIPLDSRPDDGKTKLKDDIDALGLIIEIWDKDNTEALWISKSLGLIVDRKADPLKLEEFWPCPKPIFATLTNDSLVPVPDFTLYQDQANELDILTDRIDGLVKALQVKGVYDASQKELARLFTEGANNTLIPVKNWAAFAEKNGLKNSVELLDILPLAQALDYCYKAFEQVKGQIDELMGIADIMRGQTDANETMGAQQLKSQYASLRLKTYQEQVAQFATECLQIKAQIICNLFNPQTILNMSGATQLSQNDQQLVPQAMQLLLGERAMNPDADPQNPMRSFRIEVDADSLVYMDEQAEKQSRVEFLTAAGGFLKNALEAGQQAPQLTPLLMEMLKFGVQGFKIGRTIEGQFDIVTEQLKAAAAQAAQNPKPDPKMAEIQAKTQADIQATQAKSQADAADRQQELQMRTQELNMEAQHTQQQNALEAQRTQQQAILDANQARMEAMLDAKIKLMVAEISAKATLDAAQISAANQGTNEQV